MRIVKKLIFAAVCLSIMIIGASAEENLIRPIGGTECIAGGLKFVEESEESPSLFSTPEKPLEDWLIEQCMAHAELLDVKDYNLWMSYQELVDFCVSFSIRHPELMIHSGFGGETSISDVIDENGTEIYKISKIQPLYFFDDKAADDNARAFMNQKVNEYITFAKAYEKPLEKLLAIHDKMVETCEYDDLINNITPMHGDHSYHAYGFFYNNTAVCQGYAEAFYMIASKLGIETNFCRSASLNHIWNYVKFDGKWYHVDVTWDDPVSYTGAATIKASHDNFLISDEKRCLNILSQYQNVDINDWITYLDDIPNCSSTKYESEYLFNLPFPFNISQKDGYFVASCQINGKTYDFRSQSLHAGIIAVTKPAISNSNYYEIIYLPLADYNGSLTPVIVNYKGGKATSFIKRESLSFEYLNSFIPRDTSADYTDIFIWDMANMRPACDKMRVGQ